jgi:hypothetical protein
MRQLPSTVVGPALALALLAVGFTASRSGDARPLPLRGAPAATSPLLALGSGPHGSKLEQLDPSTFTALRSSRPVGWSDGWVVAPDRTLIAVATHADGADVADSTVRFADVSTLRWARRGVRLDGFFRGAIWPRTDTLYALAGDCCGSGLTLETVDTVTKKVVARSEIGGAVTTVERTADGLVLLGAPVNELGPATLTVIEPDGRVRSTTLDEIVAGSHFDQSGRDPIGRTREPGVAVDRAHGVAYVVDPGGVVARVRLGDLSVSYHRLGRSLLARLSAWLTPPAEAKGIAGPTLTARWLGDGLIAVTGTTYSTARKKGGSVVYSTTPGGLRIVDTTDWSERTLDPAADGAVVGDGLLLASGGSWRSDSSTPTATSSGEGLAAYASDGSLRWRLDPGANLTVLAAYGSRALVQALGPGQAPQPIQLVDLDRGRVVRTFPSDAYRLPLTGSGS